MTRRQMLQATGVGFGQLGLANLMAKPHFAPKAKHVIFLFLNGGASQVDTFDPKPMLTKFHGKPAPTPNLKTERRTGNLLASPFSFKKYGQSGIEVSEIFPEVGGVIDEFLVIRSMHTDLPNHEPSLFQLNCGTRIPGRPSLGSWLTYGLGSENQNLPGYMVLCPGFPVVGPELWGSAFLPSEHQGTHIPNNEKDPEKLIPWVRNQRPRPEQRKQIDLLTRINRLHAGDPKLELFRTIGRGTDRLTKMPLPQGNAYAMLRRRAAAADIETKIGNHTFRATGITAYLKNGGTLEKAAAMATHASTRTTQLYYRRSDEVSLGDVGRVVI